MLSLVESAFSLQDTKAERGEIGPIHGHNMLGNLRLGHRIRQIQECGRIRPSTEGKVQCYECHSQHIA